MSKAEARQRLANEEKQRVFQQKFEQDVKSFQTSGQQGQTHLLGEDEDFKFFTNCRRGSGCFDSVPDEIWGNVRNPRFMLSAVPSRHDADHSLETVDLDEDDGDLESFLEDVSPLPKDSIGPSPVPNTPSSADTSQKEEAEGTGTKASPSTGEVSLETSPSSGEVADMGVSTAESMYFTPDVTLENIPLANGENKG